MHFDYAAEFAAARRHGDELAIVVLVPHDKGGQLTGRRPAVSR
jgi:hypothetical protein